MKICRGRRLRRPVNYTYYLRDVEGAVPYSFGLDTIEGKMIYSKYMSAETKTNRFVA